MSIKVPVVPYHEHEGLPTDVDPVIVPPPAHAATHETGGSDAIAHLAATVIDSGTLDGDRLPAISTTKKGAVPATGTAVGKFLRDPGTFQDIVAIDVDPPATPFDKELWYPAPDPAATVFGLQLREQRYTGIYNPEMIFSKPTATSVKCLSGDGSIGRGYMFVTLPKTAIDGRKVKLTWETNSSYASLYFVAKIVDGDYSRKSGTDFPDQASTTYTNNTFISKGAGNLQTIEIIHGTNTSHTATITANLAASTQAYITIMIYLVDGWEAQNAFFIVSGLQITDLSDVVLYSADLDGALNMESEDGYADYGMLGSGSIDYLDRPLPNLKYWDAAAGEFKDMAEAFHEGGLTTEYWRGDKEFATLNASAVINTPAGSIAAVTVQTAINELDSEKEPKLKVFVIVTTTYTVADGVMFVFCNSAIPFTVTIPTATGSGRLIIIKNVNTGTITVSKAGDTIDGETSQKVLARDSMSIFDYAANKWGITP
jgi:hypothetical protein